MDNPIEAVMKELGFTPQTMSEQDRRLCEWVVRARQTKGE